MRIPATSPAPRGRLQRIRRVSTTARDTFEDPAMNTSGGRKRAPRPATRATPGTAMPTTSAGSDESERPLG